MAATMTLDGEGRVEAASPDALSLLGLNLDELLALPPGAFSPDPPDPDGDAAFREQWEAEGRPDIGGEATLQRLDGSKVRVRFAISETEGQRFLAVLEPINAPVETAPRLYTAGDVLNEWRAAERRLSMVVEGSGEWALLTSEIESFRSRYQQFFGAR
jgi:PAS domain-containing protein